MSVTNKSYKSAICIIPPEIHWNKIQNIRKEHDKHYRRWMPHMNLLYPFAPAKNPNYSLDDSKLGENKFNKDDLLLKLKKTLISAKSFKLKLEKLDYFLHGQSSCTLWLKPETTPDNALMILEDKLIGKFSDKGFPGFDDLIKIGNEGFKPHLSLGQFSGEKSAQNAIKKFSQIFKVEPIIEFEVKEVYWITREGFHDPFEIFEKIEFGQDSETV